MKKYKGLQTIISGDSGYILDKSEMKTITAEEYERLRIQSELDPDSQIINVQKGAALSEHIVHNGIVIASRYGWAREHDYRFEALDVSFYQTSYLIYDVNLRNLSLYRTDHKPTDEKTALSILHRWASKEDSMMFYIMTHDKSELTEETIKEQVVKSYELRFKYKMSNVIHEFMKVYNKMLDVYSDLNSLETDESLSHDEAESIRTKLDQRRPIIPNKRRWINWLDSL